MELAHILPDKTLPDSRTEVDFLEAVVQQLVNMIETQRAYEVSSKSISAVDEMMRFLSNNL